MMALAKRGLMHQGKMIIVEFCEGKSVLRVNLKCQDG
jgi:hypothetical protein